jgi:ribosome-binding factor A
LTAKLYVSAYGPLRESFALKQHHRHRKDRRESPAFVDRLFAEALNSAAVSGSSRSRQGERKTQQFCRQVQRALNMALADGEAHDGLNELFVDEVTPAPHCGRLLVHVVIPADRSVADALSSLRRDSARLRSDVAVTITRKRAPELSFVPAFPEGGDDE